MDISATPHQRSDDPALEAIVMEGRCERCEGHVGLIPMLLGRTLCGSCAKLARQAAKAPQQPSR